jgi:hypothetical protein
MAERIAHGNHDGLSRRALKRHLQVTAVLDFAGELSMLIADCMHNMAAHVGERNGYILSDHSRIAQIQQLAGDHEMSAAGLGLNLQVDLKWVRAVEHLSGAASRRAGSFDNRAPSTTGCKKLSKRTEIRLLDFFLWPVKLPATNAALAILTESFGGW